MKPATGSLSPVLRWLGALIVSGGLVRAPAHSAIVHNYDAAGAAAAGPVWAIARAADGTLFVGSNRLSIYNGHAWEALPIGNAYAFRALAPERRPAGEPLGEPAVSPVRQTPGAEPRERRLPKPEETGMPALPPEPLRASAAAAGRVWVGAIGAIGYLEKQPDGTWEFVSLLRQLHAAGVADPGDIWQVHALGAGAMFLTTDRVLRWTGALFEIWHMPASPHLLSFADGDDVLVYQAGKGLWRVRAHGPPQLEMADALLPARPVTWFSPTRRLAESGVASALIGLGAEAYRLTGRAGSGAALREPHLERLDDLTAALRDTIPTYSEWIDSDVLAIGTYRAGVVLSDNDGRVRGRIDRDSGLDDDNITALHSDRRGRLWIGHGSGFARIDAGASVAHFPYRATFGSGLPKSAIDYDGTIHVLTSRGFFRGDAPIPGGGSSAIRFVPLLEAEGMLHAATVIEGELWIGGFGGMWRAGPAGVEQKYFSTTDVVLLGGAGALRGEILFVERYALKALRHTERGWASRALDVQVRDTPVSLLDVAGADAGVWVSTVAGGIYRFGWTTSRGGAGPVLRLAAHYKHGAGLPPGTKSPRLARVGGRMYALADSGLLVLRPDARGFEPAPELQEFAAVVASTTFADAEPLVPMPSGGGIHTVSPGAVQAASQLPPLPGGGYWVAQARALSGLGTYALLRVVPSPRAGALPTLEPVEAPGLDRIGRVTAVELVRTASGPTLWIAGTDGVLRLDERRLAAAADPQPARFLEVRTDAARQSVRPAEDGAPWAPAVKSVSFTFATPESIAGGAVFFQTRLAGVEAAWSPPGRTTQREFTGLRHGAYSFEVRTLDRFGRAGAPATYAFAIAPPWFVRWPALTGFAVCAAAAAGTVMRWRMVRLRRQNEKLNRLVAERTRELELSNTVRAEFLENVSHEIRNPLNGLNGLLGLLKQARLAPRERELMESLQSCARNLNRTYEEVLGFSKLEYGYITKDERRFALRGMLREIADGFAWQAAQQGCRIAIDSPGRAETGLRHGDGAERVPEGGPAGEGGDDDAFVGDAGKLRTIVTNFVGNALKYAPRQPIEIKVEQHPTDDGRVSVCIEVCDRGPGIPPEEQELIFQKFVRGSNAKSGGIAGTGLGLATCRVMARALGGSVGVESEPGRGSVFFVRIPLTRAAGAAPAGTAPPAGVAPVPDGPVRPTALIVEDEHYNQTVLQGIAATLGYETAVASDACEAAALLNTRSFDLILLDWELPGTKGGEIARQVRRAPAGDRPVIVATTGHDSDEMRQRCHDAGMDDFLLKPYDLDAIRCCVARVAEARAARPMGETGSSPAAAAVSPPVPWGVGGVSPMSDGGLQTAVRPVGRELNLRAFDHYAAGVAGKAGDAAREFVASLDREIAALADAVGAADGERIAESAHRVRALGGLLAAGDFTDAARRLESLASCGGTEQRRAAYEQLVCAGEILKKRLASRSRPEPVADA